MEFLILLILVFGCKNLAYNSIGDIGDIGAREIRNALTNNKPLRGLNLRICLEI